MSKRPAASVHLHLLSLGDVDVMCKAKKPESMSVMQYACEGVSKCTYLNPKFSNCLFAACKCHMINLVVRISQLV